MHFAMKNGLWDFACASKNRSQLRLRCRGAHDFPTYGPSRSAVIYCVFASDHVDSRDTTLEGTARTYSISSIACAIVRSCNGTSNSKSKPKAKPTKEQVQTEIDHIMREAQQKRLKPSAEERQMRDAMLAAIFKAVHEDTVPESYVGIYSTGTKDKMVCDTPRFIEFRSLPVNVQDDLMRAEILPTMWPRYKISGYERVFHYTSS